MLILQMASLGVKLCGPWCLVAMQAARAFLICGLTNSVYLTLRQRWARGAVVHGVR